MIVDGHMLDAATPSLRHMPPPLPTLMPFSSAAVAVYSDDAAALLMS